MRVTRDALLALTEKYGEMLRLRLANVEGGEDEPVAKRALLAARFPGSLREIDELSLDEIRGRMASLETIDWEPARAQPWMHAIARFHELTRAALAAKRWVSARGSPRGPGTLPGDARPWEDDLPRIATPPNGRLSTLVFERLAAELEVTPAEAVALVFPSSRRRLR